MNERKAMLAARLLSQQILDLRGLHDDSLDLSKGRAQVPQALV